MTTRDVKLEEAIAAAAQGEVVKQPLLRPRLGWMALGPAFLAFDKCKLFPTGY